MITGYAFGLKSFESTGLFLRKASTAEVSDTCLPYRQATGPA
jgi:hypothetical protein